MGKQSFKRNSGVFGWDQEVQTLCCAAAAQILMTSSKVKQKETVALAPLLIRNALVRLIIDLRWSFKEKMMTKSVEEEEKNWLN